MNPIWIVLLAVAATMVAVFAARQATTPPSRRQVRYLVGLLAVGLALFAVVLLVVR
jgi:hypothetical protein